MIIEKNPVASIMHFEDRPRIKLHIAHDNHEFMIIGTENSDLTDVVDTEYRFKSREEAFNSIPVIWSAYDWDLELIVKL